MYELCTMIFCYYQHTSVLVHRLTFKVKACTIFVDKGVYIHNDLERVALMNDVNRIVQTFPINDK